MMNKLEEKSLFDILNSSGELMDIINDIESIDGWQSKREGFALYIISKFGPENGEIVEIGSWKGKSTIWLAKGAKQSKREKITAIDPFIGSSEHKRILKGKSTFEEFKMNLKKFECDDYVNIFVDTSENVVKNWNKPVRLVFIDGAHEYEFVKKDFLLWKPFLVDGGIIGLHDSDEEGPKKIIEEYILNSNKFKILPKCGNIFFAKKVNSNL